MQARYLLQMPACIPRACCLLYRGGILLAVEPVGRTDIGRIAHLLSDLHDVEQQQPKEMKSNSQHE